jgi:hypothetical protein
MATMKKKLLAGLLIGGLFSLGCGQDTGPKGTAPKGGSISPGKAIAPAPPPSKPGEDEGTKPEPKKDEAKPEPKKDDSKKTEPKKDAK